MPPPAATQPATSPVIPRAVVGSTQTTAPANVISRMVAAMIVVAAIALGISIIATGPGGSQTSETPSSGDRQIVEVQNIHAEVPANWDVLKRAQDTIAVDDRAGRALWLRSASLPSTITLDTVQERFLDKARQEAPDAKICAGPETALVPGGPVGGRYLVICSTLIPQGGGPVVRLADAFYIGVDETGMTVFVIQLTATPESLQAFATTVRVLPPPTWKLYHP